MQMSCNPTFFTFSIEPNDSNIDEGTIWKTNTTTRDNNINNVVEGCIPTNAGLGRGISSTWCNQNCDKGRHPACQSSSGVHQFCQCSTEGIYLFTS